MIAQSSSPSFEKNSLAIQFKYMMSLCIWLTHPYNWPRSINIRESTQIAAFQVLSLIMIRLNFSIIVNKLHR